MQQGSRGFTLIELMIVIVIIGILAAIAIPNLIVMGNRAKEGSVKSNMHTLQIAAEDYGVQNGGVYSDVIDAAHIADLLPLSYRNPFDSSSGDGGAWENRASMSAAASPLRGITSYADSSTDLYNVRGHGTQAIALVLTSGR